MFKEIYSLIPDTVEYNKDDIWDFEEFQQKIISKLINLRIHRTKILREAENKLIRENPDIWDIDTRSIDFSESDIKVGIDFVYKSSGIENYKIIKLSWDEI